MTIQKIFNKYSVMPFRVFLKLFLKKSRFNNIFQNPQLEDLNILHDTTLVIKTDIPRKSRTLKLP